jgi:hypothetical protein
MIQVPCSTRYQKLVLYKRTSPPFPKLNHQLNHPKRPEAPQPLASRDPHDNLRPRMWIISLINSVSHSTTMTCHPFTVSKACTVEGDCIRTSILDILTAYSPRPKAQLNPSPVNSEAFGTITRNVQLFGSFFVRSKNTHFDRSVPNIRLTKDQTRDQ